MGESFHNIHVYQVITMYTFNLICQLYLSKAGRKTELKSKEMQGLVQVTQTTFWLQSACSFQESYPSNSVIAQ